jgi:hypothetical protein
MASLILPALLTYGCGEHTLFLTSRHMCAHEPDGNPHTSVDE